MQTTRIEPCQPSDLDSLLALYDAAADYQKQVSEQHWQGFGREAVAREIAEQRQFKVLIDGEVAGIFLVSFADPLIWGERDHDALYLHRSVTRPEFRGQGLVPRIVAWARQYAAGQGRRFLRMDTWADNARLGAYYLNCGFAPAGTITLDKPAGLPAHYDGVRLALFELPVT